MSGSDRGVLCGLGSRFALYLPAQPLSGGELSVGSGRRRTVVHVLRPGGVDGDVQLLLDLPSPYTARIVDDAMLLWLAAADFEHLLATSPPITRRSPAAGCPASPGGWPPATTGCSAWSAAPLTEQVIQLLLDEAVDGQVALPRAPWPPRSACNAPH